MLDLHMSIFGMVWAGSKTLGHEHSFFFESWSGTEWVALA